MVVTFAERQASMVLKTGKAALRRVWIETRAGFASLHGSPPDLYKVLVLKVRLLAVTALTL